MIRKYKSELKSYYCYPNENTLDYLPYFVNNIKQDKLRELLSLIMMCGYRVGEALNSYIYKQDNRIIVQAPMEKKRKFTKHVMPGRGFLGATYLNPLLGERKLWKNNVLQLHLFPEMKKGWLDNYITTDRSDPNWIFQSTAKNAWNGYKTYYKALHNYPPFEVKYILSEYQIPSTVDYIPSFHFFRKCFCAEATRTKTFKNIVELTKYVGWEKLDMAMFYIKDYGKGDERDALNMFNSSKFHYED